MTPSSEPASRAVADAPAAAARSTPRAALGPGNGDAIALTAIGLLMVLAQAGIASDESGVSVPVAALMTVAVVAAGLAVLVRPRAAVAATGLLLGAAFPAQLPDGPIHLWWPLVVFAAAVRIGPRSLWPALAAGWGALLIGQLLRAILHDQSWTETGWKSLAEAALAAAAAALGWWLRSNQVARRERTRRAATEEQLRIARELHDGVGHGLAVIAMQAGVGLHVLERDPDGARRALEAIRQASGEALESLRGELRSMTGEAPRAPGRGLDDLPALVERVTAAGPQVRLRVAGPAPDSAVVEATAYALVQEALTNVLRHAEATAVRVTVDGGEGRTLVRISDDGRGIEPTAEERPGELPGERAERPDDDPPAGMGLPGLRSRVEALGGRFRAGPLPGQGYEVTATLPWPQHAGPASPEQP